MLFIQYAASDPLFYFSWIFTVVISIILHELAHGWVAIWQGDDTPRRQKRLTLDPLVHMGPYSLITLALFGIAWGQMPINPLRFRSTFGEAYVAGAGPAMNLVLSFGMLATLAVLEVYNLLPQTQTGDNIAQFLRVFGIANMALAFFNLVPVPPLDGAKILENLNESYARLVNDPDKQSMFGIMFLLVFIFMGSVIFKYAIKFSDLYYYKIMNLLQ